MAVRFLSKDGTWKTISDPDTLLEETYEGRNEVMVKVGKRKYYRFIRPKE